MPDEPHLSAAVAEHLQSLLRSYRRLLGRPLLAESGDPLEDARRVWAAPFVVVSHDTAADPCLNYGNAAALALWRLDWAGLVGRPSRLTAEAPERPEREALLARVGRDGFIADYSGVRIAADGRRFRIERATVWNLSGADGSARGQAATFSSWHYLDGEAA